MRIALLSNVTVELLAGMLRGEHEVWTPSGFGAWLETALEPPEDLRAFRPGAIYILLDGRFDGFLPEDAARASAVAALERAFPGVPVMVPDVAGLARDFGDGFYDERMWTLARMPFSLAGLKALRALLAVHKVLALDLDNTLWTGVVGEDGVAGVSPRVEFQREIRALRERGVLLVTLSRNNPADVEPIWDDPRMVLRRDDFVAQRVGWGEKFAEVAQVAAELNLGVDSFVFVDDNPAERARMRAARPEVAVPDFPPRLADYFPARPQTAEDRMRTEQYQAETRRRASAVGLTLDAHLASLGMWMDFHAARADEFPRIAQLAQKSNQFNVLTRRLSEPDVARLAADPARSLFAVRSGDRFGELGLVAFVSVAVAGRAAEIEDWTMSCRAMNRRLEFAVEDRIERALAARGVETLRATWRRTAKNEPVRELFDRLGFARVAVDADARRYELRLPRAVPLAHTEDFADRSVSAAKEQKT